MYEFHSVIFINLFIVYLKTLSVAQAIGLYSRTVGPLTIEQDVERSTPSFVQNTVLAFAKGWMNQSAKNFCADCQRPGQIHFRNTIQAHFRCSQVFPCKASSPAWEQIFLIRVFKISVHDITQEWRILVYLAELSLFKSSRTKYNYKQYQSLLFYKQSMKLLVPVQWTAVSYPTAYFRFNHR